MIQIKFIFFLLFLSVIFAKTSFAKITLHEAIQNAYEKNPEIKAEEYSYQVSKSYKIKSIGGFLPRVYADINQGHQENKIGGNTNSTKSNIDKKSVTLSQDLFNGGKTFFDVKRSENVVKKQKTVLDDKMQNVFLGTIKAYLDILKYQELLVLTEESVVIQEDLVSYTAKKITAKDATRSELAKASADKIVAINNRNTALNNLSAAKIDFYRYTSINNDNIYPLEPVDPSLLFQNVQNLNAENLFHIAIKSNPNLQSARYSFEASKYNALAAKSALSPSVTFNMQSSEEKNLVYLSNRSQNNQSVYLNFHIPIFNSGIEYSDISIANKQEQQEKYGYHNIQNNLYNVIYDQVTDLKNLDLQHEAMSELESANNGYFIAIKMEEKFGTKSIIDLLRAKQDLYTSKTNKINAYYDMIFAMFKLKAAIGELNSMFLLDREEVNN
jgi:TolC family type I secretion outer membrane protein